MTREEREKAIGVLKISAPVTAVTQEEFNDYIQTLNKIMNWLEQEPCEDAVSCNYTTEEIAKSFIKDVESVKDQLDGQPCTDAISRQAVIDAIFFEPLYKLGMKKRYAEEAVPAIFEKIKALPPVTPQYTEAEIQKMQDLEFAEIQKAYEIGKDEGSSEIPTGWIPVSEIEDIKAEINELSELDHIEPTYEDCKRDVLEILDKYKASPTGAEGSEE